MVRTWCFPWDLNMGLFEQKWRRKQAPLGCTYQVQLQTIRWKVPCRYPLLLEENCFWWHWSCRKLQLEMGDSVKEIMTEVRGKFFSQWHKHSRVTLVLLKEVEQESLRPKSYLKNFFRGNVFSARISLKLRDKPYNIFTRLKVYHSVFYRHCAYTLCWHSTHHSVRDFFH